MSNHLVGAAEVARILGVSRQRVAQLVTTTSSDFPSPVVELTGGRVWTREAIEAWAVSHQDRGPRREELVVPRPGMWAPQVAAVMVRAGEVAIELNHRGVVDDHILLALLHPACPGAAGQVLASFGLTFIGFRQALVEIVGSQELASRPSEIRWTPKAQLVLERANLKARELEDEDVRSEHVLLALVDAWEGGRIPMELERNALSPSAVRERVLKVTENLSSHG